MKPIASLLPDDDEFKYMLDMGERTIHILPISNKLHNEAKINENKYKSTLKNENNCRGCKHGRFCRDLYAI